MKSHENSVKPAETDEFGDSARSLSLVAIANSIQASLAEGPRRYLVAVHPELAEHLDKWHPAAIEAMYARDIALGIQNPDTMV